MKRKEKLTLEITSPASVGINSMTGIISTFP